MKRKNLKKLIIIFAIISSAILACGGSEGSGEVVGNSTSAPQKTAVQLQTYNIGDIIQVQDQTIVLNSATIQGGVLKANFTIENKGTEDLAISSMIQFSAKDNDGSKLEEDIFDCGSSSMGGTILPGDKLKGDICWKTTSASPFKIYYEASLFSSGAVVWLISQ